MQVGASSTRLKKRNIGRFVTAALGAPRFASAYLRSRDQSTWVFGNRHGYIDNTRYLFEFVREQDEVRKAVWFAQDAAESQVVDASGGESVVRGTLTAKRVLREAGVGVVSNGLGDFERAELGGMKIVQLWHGTPLKKILLDYDGDTTISSRPLSIQNKVYRKLLASAWKQYFLVTAASPVAQERFSSAFGLPKERIPITGYARSDVLMAGAPMKETWHELVREFSTFSPAVLVLFAPTWREDGSLAWLENLEWEALQQVLERHDAAMLVRPHPLSAGAVQSALPSNVDRIKLLNSKRAPLRDMTSLLSHIGLLITDYSSVAFDFALLERPIVFYAPDWERYSATRGFYERYEDVVGNHAATDSRTLALRLNAALSGDEAVLEHSRWLKQRYNSYDDNKNCERIYRVIQARLRST